MTCIVATSGKSHYWDRATMKDRERYLQYEKKNKNKTGVINDPLGQPTIPAGSYFRLTLKFGTDGRTTCAKIVITTGRDCGRPRGSTRWNIVRIWRNESKATKATKMSEQYMLTGNLNECCLLITIWMTGKEDITAEGPNIGKTHNSWKIVVQRFFHGFLSQLSIFKFQIFWWISKNM